MSESQVRIDSERPRRRPAWLGVVLVGIAVAAMTFFLAWELIFPADSTINLNPGGSLDEAFDYRGPDARSRAVGVEQTPPIYPVSLIEPVGIAIGPGNMLYVVGDEALSILDPAGHGSEARTIRLPLHPRCVHVADDGTIYLGSEDRVLVLNPSGEIHATWAPLGPRARLTSLASTPADLYVADAGQRVIYRYDRQTGEIRNTIGKAPDGLATQPLGSKTYLNVPGFVVPSPYFDLVMPADGLLRVTNPGRQRVEAYDPGGYYEEPLTWGQASTTPSGFAGCCNPTQLALLSDGSFVTAEKGLNRLKVYSPMGQFRFVLADSVDLGAEASNLDLAVDSRDAVYVLDATEKIIRVFTLPSPASEPADED